MNIDLTPFLQALVGLLGALITAFLIPWIKSHTTARQRETLESVTRIAVYAAEQLYGAGNGNEKMAYVVDQLMQRGWHIDQLAIEAAVKELKITEAWYKDPPVSPDNPT